MFKKILAILIFGAFGWAYAFAPQAGTWVVASEMDGRPGRGMAIDVQNNTLVMQVYSYESSGQPSFYLAVGSMSNNQTTAPLTRYVGGRYFGSGARSGSLDSSPGNVTLRFTSGSTGYVTFPGESEQLIVRANFGYPAKPESLRGYWSFTGLGSAGVYATAVSMSVVAAGTGTGSGLMMNAAGTFACEHKTSGSLAGGVLCVVLTSTGSLERSFYFMYSINEGEGLMGIGSATPNQLLIVRRLTTADGLGTGLVFKAENEASLDPSHARGYLDALSSSAPSR